MPNSIFNSDGFEMYVDFLKQSKRIYSCLVNNGVKKEDARFVLPQAVTTKMMMTINFRSLRNLLNLRLDVHAQWEVRKVAAMMVAELSGVSPELVDTIFGDILKDKNPS